MRVETEFWSWTEVLEVDGFDILSGSSDRGMLVCRLPPEGFSRLLWWS